MQVRVQQIAAVMEGDLQEGGRTAAAIVAAADAVRTWAVGKGGAFFAAGEPSARLILSILGVTAGRQFLLHSSAPTAQEGFRQLLLCAERQRPGNEGTFLPCASPILALQCTEVTG